jgi:hypothetical protein
MVNSNGKELATALDALATRFAAGVVDVSA